MKRNIRRFRLPIFIALVLLLALVFSSGVLADDGPAAFNVTVPSTLPVVVGSDGGVTVASNAQIVNNSAFAVRVDSLSVVPQNSWQLKAWGTDYNAVKVDSKQFSMQIGGSAVTISGYVSAYRNMSIDANGTLDLSYNAKIATQTANLNEAIANVVFTVSWSGKGPLTGISVRRNPTTTAYTEGDAFRQFGLTIAATYANGSTSTVYGWTVTDGSSLEYGQTSVTVSYTEGGITKTVEVPITVKQKAYAILYSDGELVFQRGNTPAPGKTVVDTYTGFETAFYYVSSYNPYTINTPWHSRAAEIKKVTIKDTISPQYMSYWFADCSNLTTLNGANLLDTSGVYDFQSMFLNCSSLFSVDFSSWDTANVSNMSFMFSGCSSLSIANLAGWDTGSVTNMSSMFSVCSSLTNVGLTNWNTSKVRNMSGMFWSCEGLNALDLSRWDVGSVTNMSNMFNDCNGLTRLSVGGWNTSKVTTMKGMFSMPGGNGKLISLDVKNWNTTGVTDMSSMFSGCASLVTLDLSGWDTSAVTTMRGMFNHCNNLVSLDVSSFDTSNVTSMSAMFLNVAKIKTLDVSSFDTSKVTDMASMFGGCTELRTIYASEKFVVNSSLLDTDMFWLSTKLVGGNGTTYSAITATYARIDRAGTPGYFTEKAASRAAAVQLPVASDAVELTLDEGTEAEDIPEDSEVTIQKQEDAAFSEDGTVDNETPDADGLETDTDEGSPTLPDDNPQEKQNGPEEIV